MEHTKSIFTKRYIKNLNTDRYIYILVFISSNILITFVISVDDTDLLDVSVILFIDSERFILYT